MPCVLNAFEYLDILRSICVYSCNLCYKLETIQLGCKESGTNLYPVVADKLHQRQVAGRVNHQLFLVEIVSLCPLPFF